MELLKKLLHRLLGRHYARVRQIKNSDVARTAVAVTRIPINRYQQRQNRGHFVFDIVGQMGLGGMLTHVVKLSKSCKDQGLVPVARFSNPLYASVPDEDWFGRLFIHKGPSLPSGGPSFRALIVKNEKSYLGFDVPHNFALREAHDVFFRYFDFQPSIVAICDRVMAPLARAEFDISLHYRGTDKLLEAGSVSFADFSEKLGQLLGASPGISTAFLATDTQEFDRYIRQRFPQLQFYTYNVDAFSEAGVPRHFSTLSGDLKAVEALVNMILIGRSSVCVRTASYLSAWSKIFNPRLRTITLNRLHRSNPIFPEHEIAEEEAAVSTTSPTPAFRATATTAAREMKER